MSTLPRLLQCSTTQTPTSSTTRSPLQSPTAVTKSHLKERVISQKDALRVKVFLLSCNDTLLEAAVRHYRLLLGEHVDITLLDNFSGAQFLRRAKSLGVSVKRWGSDPRAVIEHERTRLKNTAWKAARAKNFRWVIIADMDEWLHVSAADLDAEERAGHTVLTTHGFNVVGKSRLAGLGDIDLHAPVFQGFSDTDFDKRVCFNPNAISDIRFKDGCHVAAPRGKVVFSTASYILAHMSSLGLKHLQEKHKHRYEHTDPKDKLLGMNTHYKKDAATTAFLYSVQKTAATVWLHTRYYSSRAAFLSNSMTSG